MILFTYGYRQGDVAELQRIAAALVLVVDIRMQAGSRQRAFNKGALKRLLGDRYRHLPDLGNVNYRDGGPIVLRDEEQGTASLAELMQGAEVCLLCACREWQRCHREYVARRMEERLPGTLVVHLDAADILRRWPRESGDNRGTR